MEEKMKKLICIAVLLFAASELLCGCAAIEPEKRAYPLSFSVDYKNDAYEVIYAMANLAGSTGKEKQEGSQKNEGKQPLAFSGSDFAQIRQRYDESQEYYLDLGHVQAILFSRRLLRRPQEYEETLRYLQSEEILGQNARVFVCDEPGEVIAAAEGTGTSLGEFLSGMYENQPEQEKSRALELGTLYQEYYNYNTIPSFPELNVEEGRILLLDKV